MFNAIVIFINNLILMMRGRYYGQPALIGQLCDPEDVLSRGRPYQPFDDSFYVDLGEWDPVKLDFVPTEPWLDLKTFLRQHGKADESTRVIKSYEIPTTKSLFEDEVTGMIYAFRTYVNEQIKRRRENHICEDEIEEGMVTFRRRMCTHLLNKNGNLNEDNVKRMEAAGFTVSLLKKPWGDMVMVADPETSLRQCISVI